MRVYKFLALLIFITACSESSPPSRVNNVGIEGCSHSFRELPWIEDGEQVMKTYSNIEFAVNFKIVDEAIGLAKENGKNAPLQVVGTLYKKDGSAVERAGNIIYFYEDGNYSFTQNWLPVAVDKDEFVETFGSHPKVECEIVGM